MENYNVNYSVHLPSYSIGPDCYNEVPYVTRFFGKTAVVLGGETAMEKAKPALLKGVEGSDVELLGFLPYGGDSTYENGDALIANPLVQKADMIFAMAAAAPAIPASTSPISLISRSLPSRPLRRTALPSPPSP